MEVTSEARDLTDAEGLSEGVLLLNRHALGKCSLVVRRAACALVSPQVAAAQINPALLGIRTEKSPSRLLGTTWTNYGLI